MVSRGLTSVHTCRGSEAGFSTTQAPQPATVTEPHSLRTLLGNQIVSTSNQPTMSLPSTRLDHFKGDVLALSVAIQPEHQPLAGARQLLQVAPDLLVLALGIVDRQGRVWRVSASKGKPSPMSSRSRPG